MRHTAKWCHFPIVYKAFRCTPVSHIFERTLVSVTGYDDVLIYHTFSIESYCLSLDVSLLLIQFVHDALLWYFPLQLAAVKSVPCTPVRTLRPAVGRRNVVNVGPVTTGRVTSVSPSSPSHPLYMISMVGTGYISLWNWALVAIAGTTIIVPYL